LTITWSRSAWWSGVVVTLESLSPRKTTGSTLWAWNSEPGAARMISRTHRGGAYG